MDVPEVDCSEATAMRSAGAAWVDVRELEEWAEARIEGTEHIPLAAAVEELPRRYPDLQTPIIVSCLSGGRSGQLVSHLRERGYLDVHNLRGGIRAWVADGRAVLVGA